MEARMNYIRLLTHNYKKMWDFYSGTLGLKPRFNEKNGSYEEFATQDAILSIYEKQLMINELKNKIKDSENNANDNFVIILKVNDVNTIYDELKKKNVKFVSPPTDRNNWVIRTAHFRDPDGNLIEINQPL